MPENRNTGFVAFAWSLLVLNVAAVGWGVFLRAGRFGDGCGGNWPLCGESNPVRGQISRLIEGSHRAMTSLIGLLAIIMAVWAWRRFARGSATRRYAYA
ncbi:heme A synthase, partial [bacterium]